MEWLNSPFFLTTALCIIVIIAVFGVRGRSNKAFANLQEELQLRLTAMNVAANAIVITDRKGTCIWVNPAFTLVSGYSSEEMVSLLREGKEQFLIDAQTNHAQ